ncbi:MAG: RNA-directed DNA polymerase [Deltaproteobacteria bacterium]
MHSPIQESKTRATPGCRSCIPLCETGWDAFVSRSEKLAKGYDPGFVIVADITDFYNQIYTHRIRNLIEEAGDGTCDEQALIIETFLSGLNKKTSRGIPVGPAPSIIIAELIMADIDNKIMTYTKDFVRYVDDIRIFFKNREDASYALHELTQYLYSCHRLVFSGEKTKIVSTKRFLDKYLIDEEREENTLMIAKAEELAVGKVDELIEKLSPYVYDFADLIYEREYERAISEIMENEKFQVLSSTYFELFEKLTSSSAMDFALLRHLLRRAARYRVRNLVPLVLHNFEKLLPVLREAIVYLNKVLNKEIVINHQKQFNSILSAHYMRLPFVNLWISYLLQNQSFKEVSVLSNYDAIHSIRGKALIAMRRHDTTWVKSYRDGIDVLGPWDKRAVLYSSTILSLDEMKAWAAAVGDSGDIVDKSLALYIISERKSKAQ